MAKPYFEESSKQFVDLFDQPIDDKQIDRIILSTFVESPKSSCLVLGIVPEYMNIEEILGYHNNGFQCSTDFSKRLLKERIEIQDFEKECYNNYELNKKAGRNTMSIVYFKQNKPPYNPLFFSQLCVPIHNLGVALLNRRKRYVYVGKYISGLEDVIKYNSVVKKMQEEDRILSRYAVEHIINNSKKIHQRIMQRLNDYLEESKSYSEKPF